MPSLEEIANSGAGGAQLKAALDAGIDAISGGQAITFVKYVRKVLPLDGFVFWVKASLYGDTTPNMTIGGSLHLTSENIQQQDEAYSRNMLVFTSKEDAGQSFNSVGPADALIGTVLAPDGAHEPIRFMFSRLGFYKNAGIFHYSGVAIMPVAYPQIVDDLTLLDPNDAVITNSLPAWLSLNDYDPFYGFGNTIPLFPSFLVPPNTVPPYGTIHIDRTEGVASAPFLDRLSSHFQMAREFARVTLYGVRNDDALTFLDCALQYISDYNVIGLMNTPTVRDEKSSQTELGVLAQKKSIEFEVSYDQLAIRNVARQMIRVALVSVNATEVLSASPC